MTPEAALAKQIELYRAKPANGAPPSRSIGTSSPATWPARAFATNSPDASANEVERELRRRIELSRQLRSVPRHISSPEADSR